MEKEPFEKVMLQGSFKVALKYNGVIRYYQLS